MAISLVAEPSRLKREDLPDVDARECGFCLLETAYWAVSSSSQEESDAEGSVTKKINYL